MTSAEDSPPVVGTVTEYQQAPFERRRQWTTGEDLVRITGPEKDRYVVSHPDLIKDVLLEDSDDYRKFDPYKQIFGGGIVAVEGEQWRNQRRELQPFFETSRVRSYSEKISDIATDIADGLEDGTTFDAYESMKTLALRVMLQALFSETDENRTITEATDSVTHWFRESASTGEIPGDVQDDYERGMERLLERIHDMIDAREQGEGGDDLLSILLAAGETSDADYTDERIRDEMVTMLFGAHETSAIMLTYTLHLVADAPEVQDRLVAEVDDVLDGDEPGEQHLDELTYMEQVIDESLRYRPPAHAIFRETTTDTTLGGYAIPEESIVQLPECVVHRDERWWDDPDEFRPSRFAGESDRHSFAFFPFGVGPRQCIGERFARIEAKLSLAVLFDRFTFDRVTEDFDMYASLTAAPDRPIKLTPHARDETTVTESR